MGRKQSHKDHDLRYISRVDFPNFRTGWLMRIYPQHPDYVAWEYFYDKDYGSDVEALIAAMDYRDWIEDNMPVPPGYTGWYGIPYGFQRTLRKGNKSGCTGVSYQSSIHFNRRTRYMVRVNEWRASWRENGKSKIKRFNCATHGYEKAKELAIEYRKEMERKLIEMHK